MKPNEPNPSDRVLILTPAIARRVAAELAEASRPPAPTTPEPPRPRRRWGIFRRR